MKKLKIIKGYKILKKFVDTYWNETNILMCQKPDIDFFVVENKFEKQEHIRNILALFYFKFWHTKYLEKPIRTTDIFKFIRDYNSQISLDHTLEIEKDVMTYRARSMASVTYKFSTISQY